MKNSQQDSIISIKYDGFCKMLTVTFNDFKVYQCADVPKNVHKNFKRCKFKDKFFATKIVGKYKTRMIHSRDTSGRISIMVDNLIREVDNNL